MLNINELPEELLLIIFNNYLDFRNKLNAKSVCKHWFQLIEDIFKSTKALVITDDRHEYNLSAFKAMVNNYSYLNLKPINNKTFSPLSEFRSYICFALKMYPNLCSICLCFNATKSDRIFELLVAFDMNYNLLNVCLLTFYGVFVLRYYEVEKFCQTFPNIKHLYIETRLLYAQEISIRLLFRLLPHLKTFVLDVLHAIHSPRHRDFVVIDKSLIQNINAFKAVQSFTAINSESKYLYFSVKF